jgi:hypothetical protein
MQQCTAKNTVSVRMRGETRHGKITCALDLKKSMYFWRISLTVVMLTRASTGPPLSICFATTW